MDVKTDKSALENLPEYSVSDLSGAVKKSIEDNFGYVRVRGELGRVSRPASGHVYLDLKDDKAVMSGIIWKGVAQSLPVQPEQGLDVICTGRMTTYPGQSKYQLIIEQMEPAGAGALMALLEERKRVLTAEGLFAPERKAPLPYLPETIGVVTSPSGAVIRDILHRLDDRFPRHVLVWAVRVQGETCAQEVAAAIAGFNGLERGGEIPRPDVLIIARGGGSLEDLWGFNEEIVVRAAAASEIPLISAVGHETDTTLIDYAADKRAPTPTAAAEMAVPVRAELQAQLLDFAARQFSAQTRVLETKHDKLSGLSRGLPKFEDMLALPSQRLDSVTLRLARGLMQNVTSRQATLDQRAAKLNVQTLKKTIGRYQRRIDELHRRRKTGYENTVGRIGESLKASMRQLNILSHESVLARGFALVFDGANVPVRQLSQAPIGADLTIQLSGAQKFGARVETHNVARAEARGEKSKKQKNPPAKQTAGKTAGKNAKQISKQAPKQGDLF